MNKQDYKKYSEKELNKLIKDLKIRLMRTYHFTEGSKSEKPESRPRLRKERARVETELSKRRKNE